MSVKNILSFLSGKKSNTNQEIIDSINTLVRINYNTHKSNEKYSIQLVDKQNDPMKCFDCKSYDNGMKIIELLHKSEYPLTFETSQSDNSQFIQFSFSTLK